MSQNFLKIIITDKFNFVNIHSSDYKGRCIILKINLLLLIKNYNKYISK